MLKINSSISFHSIIKVLYTWARKIVQSIKNLPSKTKHLNLDPHEQLGMVACLRDNNL